MDEAPHSVADDVRDWFFTFGFGHENAGRFVKIRGTFVAARQAMHDRFGRKWCAQYPDAEAAGVQRWGYRELP